MQEAFARIPGRGETEQCIFDPAEAERVLYNTSRMHFSQSQTLSISNIR